MAKKVTWVVFDDLNGEELTESEHHAIQFAVLGKEYEIDLGRQNAEQFLARLEPYMAAAALVRKPAKASPEKRETLQQAREWARANGYQVADRGRVREDILEAYEAARTS